jgi:hypothetical protein
MPCHIRKEVTVGGSKGSGRSTVVSTPLFSLIPVAATG